MGMLPRLLALLDERQVSYSHHVHPIAYTARELALAEHLPPREIAKVVVFYGERGYGMAVLPADFVVDIEDLKAVLDLERLRLATEKELAELFPDCDLGAMPPFGNLYGLPVYVDASVARQQTIAFNAGTHRDVVHMRYFAYEALVQPSVVHFAHWAAI